MVGGGCLVMVDGGAWLVVCEVGRREMFPGEELRHGFVVIFFQCGCWLIVRFPC